MIKDIILQETAMSLFLGQFLLLAWFGNGNHIWRSRSFVIQHYLCPLLYCYVWWESLSSSYQLKSNSDDSLTMTNLKWKQITLLFFLVGLSGLIFILALGWFMIDEEPLTVALLHISLQQYFEFIICFGRNIWQKKKFDFKTQMIKKAITFYVILLLLLQAPEITVA